MNASWAAVVVALAGLLGLIAGRLWTGGRREGRVDAVLEEQVKTNNRQADTNDQLARLVEDLDDRVRTLEYRPPRRGRR